MAVLLSNGVILVSVSCLQYPMNRAWPSLGTEPSDSLYGMVLRCKVRAAAALLMEQRSGHPFRASRPALKKRRLLIIPTTLQVAASRLVHVAPMLPAVRGQLRPSRQAMVSPALCESRAETQRRGPAVSEVEGPRWLGAAMQAPRQTRPKEAVPERKYG